ncbi:hypothetical protein KFL_005690120, partial [Klebsormidium nitens]
RLAVSPRPGLATRRPSPPVDARAPLWWGPLVCSPPAAAATARANPSARPAVFGGAGFAPRHAAAVRAQSCAVPSAHPVALAGVRLVPPRAAQWAHGLEGPSGHHATWGDAGLAHHRVVRAQHCPSPSVPQGPGAHNSLNGSHRLGGGRVERSGVSAGKTTQEVDWLWILEVALHCLMSSVFASNNTSKGPL